ncbi:MAG TPA: DUF6174 domain-containing protein [Phototrophicaceae bacterium]|nr:DUF6174 domain-containing protein [Phototrophicaceae bacterium]
MNRQDAKSAELKNKTLHKISKGWLTCLAIAGLLVLLPALVNTVVVTFNRLKWENTQIDDYTLTLAYVGPGLQPIQTVTVTDGEIVKSVARMMYYGGKEEVPSVPFLDLTVEELFGQAYRCLLYSFCRVDYDAVYGYPKWLGGTFVEPDWIEVVNFEPREK